MNADKTKKLSHYDLRRRALQHVRADPESAGVMGHQPIPTRYAGAMFRSRLEARWAVFFDQLGITWAYEPKAFCDGDWIYTPDFHVTREHPTCPLELWVEVKPFDTSLDLQPDVAVIAEACRLCVVSGNDVTLVTGQPIQRRGLGLRYSGAEADWCACEYSAPGWSEPEGPLDFCARDNPAFEAAAQQAAKSRF